MILHYAVHILSKINPLIHKMNMLAELLYYSFFTIAMTIFFNTFINFPKLLTQLAQHPSVYIYIYTFSRRIYPKRLTVLSGYTFFQYVCSLGIDPTTFALLMQCSTTEPQEQW